MPTLELILRDDNGQIMGEQSVKKYPLDLKTKSFHDIEGAVENFKQVIPNTTKIIYYTIGQLER